MNYQWKNMRSAMSDGYMLGLKKHPTEERYRIEFSLYVLRPDGDPPPPGDDEQIEGIQLFAVSREYLSERQAQAALSALSSFINSIFDTDMEQTQVFPDGEAS